MPLGPPLGSKDQDVAYYAAIFDRKYPGRGTGAAYTSYAAAQMAENPRISPYQAARAFLLIIAIRGLAAALQAAATGTGMAVAQASRSGFGADFFHGLNLTNWLLRTGEILLGIVLIAVGVAKMTSAVPIATKMAKTAGAVGLAA